MRFELNLPNALTILRVLLIPIIIIFIWIGTMPFLWLALALYIISAITDSIDGALARKLNQMSEFGAFLDPLADKIMVITLFAVFIFIPDTWVPWWMVLLILIRDLLITHIRNVFKREKIPFTTSKLAKSKTVVQMIILGLILLYLILTRYFALVHEIPKELSYTIWEQLDMASIKYIPLIITIIALLFTYISGIDYLVKYKKLLSGGKGGK